ncbi:iron uptake porin [Nostoc sp. CHAB 5824]|nr:iron uptake porin [Nostoc sp. CHAB 5824]
MSSITSVNATPISEKSNNLIEYNADNHTLSKITSVSELSAELETLEKQVTLLETNVARLKRQQFSPHVELEAEVIFAVTGFAGEKRANSSKPINENLVLSDRVRLSFVSSFNRKDKLEVRLQARNTPALEDVTGTQMTNLGFDGNDENEVEVDELEYRFPHRWGFEFSTLCNLTPLL